MQTRELREYCKRRNLRIVGEYADIGVSGSKDSRPELNRLMADAKQRKFDAVCVWKLDRFGRSLRHLVNALAEFESLGICFVSLKDNLDLSTPSGRLMFQIIGAMAEFERALPDSGTRRKAGMRHAKGNGKAIGEDRKQAWTGALDQPACARPVRLGARLRKQQDSASEPYILQVQKGCRAGQL